MRYKRVSAAIFLVAIPIFGDTTTYNSRDIFLNSVGQSVTDDYSSPGYGYDISDAAMSAVLGQTQYRAISFPNINLVASELGDATAYCAGCNGSFDLIFTSTTLGNTNGVYGAGFDVVINDGYLGFNASAAVTFGDGTRRLYALPIGNYVPYAFWGITSDSEIREIDIVRTDGQPSPSNDEPTQQIVFAMDSLTIASAQKASALPEPSLGVLSGLCLIAAATFKLHWYRSREAARR
jgi:hypothetical protein